MQTDAEFTDTTVNELFSPNVSASMVDSLSSDLLHNYNTESYPWDYAWNASRTNTSDIRKGL